MGMTEIEARSKIKYRIGVIKEIAGNRYDDKFCEDLEIALQVMKEIREYREIGTVEELKALKEKNEPKKVVVEHVPKTSWTREVSHYLCPCCNNYFSFGGTTYCPNCGQKVDWEGGVTDER